YFPLSGDTSATIFILTHPPVCNNWAYSPPQSKAKQNIKSYSLVGYALSAWALNIIPKIIFYKRRNAELSPFYLL
ncbi:MAG: hypothetical protein ACI3X6_00370, partial [Alloprevotella sp.]